MRQLGTGFSFTVVILTAIFTCQNVFAGPALQPSQDNGSNDMAPRSESAGLLRQNNITSTGATVPRPGASQGAGPTPLDHDIERLNDKIDHSICKGC